MDDLQIVPLYEKPEFASTCAAWSFGQWGCHYDNKTLENSIKNYELRASNTETLPLTWIGIINEKIVGMISLVECDHEDRKDLTPWLASMFVHPDFRRKGYASKLIQHLHENAKKLGFNTLYLFTPDMKVLYDKNGWTQIGTVRDPRGFHENETLMEIDL